VKHRGKLKIFLGYAAGVGKTYAMFKDAQNRLSEGIDVVIGYVETHERMETKKLIDGIEMVPRKEIPYKGITLTDLDLEALLQRKPQLAIVDELAHINSPNQRHPKRWQDVKELLDEGINVYTTLNVQNIESLNDTVLQIIGNPIREKVPDMLLDKADEIVLIDISPEELRRRLKEGKVYVPKKFEASFQEFYKIGTLNALRQLAMRRVAMAVDSKMRAYMESKSIPGPWPANERLLVCLGPSKLSEKLVRSTKQIASELKAEWFAIYVENPKHRSLRENEQEQLLKNFKLAGELGAQVVSIPGDNIADTVVEYAKKYNITKIIAGKPLCPKWKEIIKGSIVDQIIRRSGSIDVYVVTTSDNNINFSLPSVDKPRLNHRKNYLLSIGLVILATAIGVPIHWLISPTNLVMLYLFVVVWAALYLGRGPSIVASVTGVLAFDFFMVPPRHTFVVHDSEYIITFIGLLSVGLIISNLTASAREQAQVAQKREVHTIELYELSRDLNTVGDLKGLGQKLFQRLENIFFCELAFYVSEKNGTLKLKIKSDKFVVYEKLDEITKWVYEHGITAGIGTDNFHSFNAQFIPLKASEKTVAILVVVPKDIKQFNSIDNSRLLDAYVMITAMAVERVLLTQEAKEMEMLKITEKIQSALLNSISHELRTPLSSIAGVLSTLKETTDEQRSYIRINEETKTELIDTAWGEALKLNRLVGNLLEMTRLESGAINLRAELNDIQELIGEVVRQMADRVIDREVSINIPDNLPLVKVDFVLMSLVLSNLIDNAVKYSPSGSPIDIKVHHSSKTIKIYISDRGMGIPSDERERVFDKFYRIRKEEGGGTGLGLSISKGIVEAHGGYIWADERDGGGTVVTISLPL